MSFERIASTGEFFWNSGSFDPFDRPNGPCSIGLVGNEIYVLRSSKTSRNRFTNYFNISISENGTVVRYSTSEDGESVRIEL